MSNEGSAQSQYPVPVRAGWDAGSGRTENMTRWATIIENAGSNYSAYVPGLPGCIATGDTVDEVERELPDAIQFHIKGLKDDGLPVPEPTSLAEYVQV